MTKKGLGDEVYGGLAGFGKIAALVGAIIITVIGVIMIIVGIIMLIHKTKLTSSTTGTIPVKGASCSPDPNNPTNFKCALKVNYTVDGKSLSSETNTDGIINYEPMTLTRPMKNLQIFYDPDDPSNIGLSSDNTGPLGWVLIVIAIIMIAGSWIWVWITRKSKMAAAAGGAASIVDMFTQR